MVPRRDALRLVFGLPLSGGLAFTQKLGAQERAPQSWPTRTITIVVRRIGLS